MSPRPASHLQIAVAAMALGSLAVLLFGRGLRVAAPTQALTAVGLLVAYAAWSGVSIAWSVAPDLSWEEMNRAVAYALVAALALVVGASLPRAVERAALGYLAVAAAIALYALGGKTFPWLNVPGIFDLNHAAEFARLQAPLGYWNALALICVLAVPVAACLAADPDRSRRWRLGGVAAFAVLLVVIALTYSRGGLLALALVVVATLAVSDRRARVAAVTAAGLVGALPPVLVGLLSHDLTTDRLAVAERTDDGLLLLAALVVGIGAAMALSAWLLGKEQRLGRPRRPRGARRRLAGTAIAAAVAVAVAVSTLAGSPPWRIVGDQVRDFTTVEFPRDAPSRIAETSSGNRWQWWNEAAGAWWDRPLAGHGAGAFPVVHLAYRHVDLPVRQAHSVPLQFLAEGGLVGAALALGGLGFLGAAALRRARRSSGPERRYAVALSVGLCAWAVHAWLDWDWNIPGATLPALVLAGVLAARPLEVESPSLAAASGARSPAGAAVPSRPARGAVLAWGALLACVVALSAYLPVMARERTNDAFAAAERGRPRDLVEAAKQAEIAKRLNPLSDEPVLAAASFAERRGRLHEASELLGEAVAREPESVPVWTALGRFQLLIGDAAGALRSAAVLARLDPRHSEPADFLLAFALNSTAARSPTATPAPLVATGRPPGR